MNSKQKYIIPTVIMITLGALVSREYPVVGYWIVVAGVGAYLLLGSVPMVRNLKNFPTLGRRKQAALMSWAVMLLMLVSILWSGRLFYFIILVLLVADYFIYDNRNAK